MIFRKFKESDKSACINIWNQSFPGDDVFSEMFFSEIIENADAYVCEYDSVTAGFISVFHFVAECDSKHCGCHYIYGVCVHPSFRNNGIMRKMISEIIKLYDGQLILIPQIFGVYEKFGFKYANNLKTVSFVDSIGNGIECYDIDILDRIYNEYRKNFTFSLRRSRRWWEIIIKSATKDGYKIFANDGAYAVIKDGVIIELAYISDVYKDSLPIGNAVLKLPSVMVNGNKNIDKCYIALMLEWE